MASLKLVEHPFRRRPQFLYGTIFIGGLVVSWRRQPQRLRLFAEEKSTAAPPAPGVSGGCHSLRPGIAIGETMTVESITGSVFTGSMVRRR